MAWLKLIRWQNLVIILLTQFLAWACVIVPASPRVLDTVNFFCITTSTLLIAAAGYIINDYFDLKIDLINRPGKVILEKIIPGKQAIISHSALNFVALLLAGYVALGAGRPEWLAIQLGCTLLLWFYSTHLKRQYITGNIAISLLTALTILSLVVYEPSLFSLANRYFFSVAGWVLLTYAFFAFMLTWMREIVKDMEDALGDEAEGCVTMPVKKGFRYATRITVGISLLAMAPLTFAAVMLFQASRPLLGAYVLLLVLAMAAWSVFLTRGTTSRHYHAASSGLKLIMLMGVCSLILYHFQ